MMIYSKILHSDGFVLHFWWVKSLKDSLILRMFPFLIILCLLNLQKLRDIIKQNPALQNESKEIKALPGALHVV